MIDDEFIPFFRPSISEEAIEGVANALRSGWLTTGPLTTQFEEQFGSIVGADYAVAVNSCTAGLHLALAALGIGHGDEVIIPTMTFAATGEVVIHLGATPVLVDCEARSLNIDTDAIEGAITDRTRAIIPVHYAGQPADMDRIRHIASNHEIPVVEDAAHAFPAAYADRPIGSLSEATCFSFYATKTLTTGEGGMVTTSNRELAERIRMLSLHGLSSQAWGRYTERGNWDYDIAAAGFKYNLTDVAAALGLDQLAHADEFRSARVSQAHRYADAFVDHESIACLATSEATLHAWHLYVVELALDQLRINRNEFIEILKDRRIGTSVHFRPLHMHSLYRNRYGLEASAFPVATSSFERIVSLPIYPSLGEQEQARVIDSVLQVLDEHRAE